MPHHLNHMGTHQCRPKGRMNEGKVCTRPFIVVFVG